VEKSGKLVSFYFSQTSFVCVLKSYFSGSKIKNKKLAPKNLLLVPIDGEREKKN
jgi:hypothetical protein